MDVDERNNSEGSRRLRSGHAEARLRLPDEIRDRLEAETADATRILEASRTAAELAAQRVPQLVTSAVPAELTEVSVDYVWTDLGLQVAARVEGFSRRTLNGRALAVVQTFMVSLAEEYPDAAGDFEIDGMGGRERGKKRRRGPFDPPVKVAVVVISDAVEAGDKEDRAGETVRAAVDDLADRGIERVSGRVLPDDADRIEETIRDLVDDGVELVITVGGTGVTHTDQTVETLEPMIDTEIPGIMEAARAYGLERTPYAMMSRGVAGLVDETLVVTFPGSSSGAEETSEALLPEILHVIRTRRKSRRELT